MSDDNGFALLQDLQRKNDEMAAKIGGYADTDDAVDFIKEHGIDLSELDEKRKEDEIEDVDIGPYCVECREDTTGQEGRTEQRKASVKVLEDGTDKPETKAVWLKGWLCESCQPFENQLVEQTAQSLYERHPRAQAVIRRKLRRMGIEDIWARYHGPMIDALEDELELEDR